MQKNWQQVNHIVNSIDGIKRAEPNVFLYNKILNRLKPQPLSIHYYSNKFIAGVAASILIIAGLNFISIVLVKKSNKTVVNEQAAMQQLATEYFIADKTTAFWY